MSKIVKNFANLFAISVFCLISLTPMVSQAQKSGASDRDFKDDPTPTPDPKPSDDNPSEPPVATTVSCDQTNLTTVVKRGDKKAVLITWKTNEFGGVFTREERCRIVSARFSSAVQANGGELKGLLLTNGQVNGRIVICALRPGEEECSTENMLFTLKKENETKAGAILGRLLNISVTGSGSSIEENSGQQVKVDMGLWASRNLRSAGASNTNRNTPSIRRPANTGF